MLGARLSDLLWASSLFDTAKVSCPTVTAKKFHCKVVSAILIGIAESPVC